MRSFLIALALLFAPAIAAASCPSLPFTLTNGQTADANQVMANLNSINTCAGNAVQAGPNFNITSLNGLTTPLSIPQGGTGATTGSGAVSNLGGLLGANNLTDVANELTALSNLGGVAKVNNGSDFSSPSTTFTNLAPAQAGNSGKFLTTNGTAASWASVVLGYAEFQDQETSGTGGAVFSSGAWRQRVLNTTLVNTIGATLTSNQITGLPLGTYCVFATGSINISGSPGQGRSKIRNITAGANVVLGPEVGLTTGTTGEGTAQGCFVLSATTTIEFDTYINAGTLSMGTAVSTGDPEIYSDVTLEKIG